MTARAAPIRCCEAPACALPLPPRSGRGRPQRHCDASCRSAARRARQRAGRCGQQVAGLACDRRAAGEIVTGRGRRTRRFPLCGQCRPLVEATLRARPRAGEVTWQPLPAGDVAGGQDRSVGGPPAGTHAAGHGPPQLATVGRTGQ